MQEHDPATDDRTPDPSEHDAASASAEQLLADLHDPDMLARATLSFGLNTLTRQTHDALAPGSDTYSLGAMMLAVLQRGHRVGYNVDEVTEDGVFVIEPEQSPAHVVFSHYAKLNVWEWKIGTDDRRNTPVIEVEYLLTEIGSDPDIVTIEFTISNATSVDGTRNLHYLVTKVTLDRFVDETADEEPTHRRRSWWSLVSILESTRRLTRPTPRGDALQQCVRPGAAASCTAVRVLRRPAAIRRSGTDR